MGVCLLFWKSGELFSQAPQSEVRSLEVNQSGVVVRSAPHFTASKRGSIREGTRIVGREWVPESGGRGIERSSCESRTWVKLDEEMYVCSDFLSTRAGGVTTERLPRVPQGALLPYQYGFAAHDGVLAYRAPGDFFLDDWSTSLGAGFAMALVDRREVSGRVFVKSRSGIWVLESELRMARGSVFEGHAIQTDEVRTGAWLQKGWIVRDTQVLDAQASGARGRGAGGRGAGRLLKHQTIMVLRTDRSFAYLPSGQKIRLRDVALPRVATTPREVGDARWIDVDTQTQVVTAYQGVTPVYTTLMSSGKSGSATPLGVHRVWAKLAEDTLDNLQRDDVSGNYAIESVPWVAYFTRDGVALHAAFWHEDFGQKKSHGCVNLSPKDAKWFFEFTSPELLPGFDAILSTERSQGTLISVR